MISNKKNIRIRLQALAIKIILTNKNSNADESIDNIISVLSN